MPQMSKVELYAAIRRDHRGGMSMRDLERKHGVTWQTVRKALDSSWPEPRKKLPPRATRLDQYKPVIDEILRADLDAPRKQRHTVTRIFHRLVEEHGADVSYGMVRYYVAGRKPEILVESGKAPLEAFVPQTHLPGHEAEVDFGDVTVRLAGELVTCYLFSLRLSYSGKAVHRVFASCGQEAFFEGHVHALRMLGGVPRSKVRYDNLKAAVARVMGQGRARTEADRWIAFRSHFGIESFYCRPGIEGAHEKGGVEGMIGYFRRNHFVPVPEVSSLAELNEMVEQWDRQDDARRIGARPKTVAEYFALEQPLLMPLPEEPFETGRLFTPTGRPLRADPGPHQPILGPDPADRQTRARRAARLSSGGLRPECGSGPSRAAYREGRRPSGPGPLPGSPGPQARSLPRLHGSRTGPFSRQVHPGPRRLVGPGPQDPRRAGRNPGPDRSPAAGAAFAP